MAHLCVSSYNKWAPFTVLVSFLSLYVKTGLERWPCTHFVRLPLSFPGIQLSPLDAGLYANED